VADVDVGIGLPNAVPDTDGSVLADWARRAELADFSTLGTIGRLAFPSYDDLIALAAAAAVTERIRLTTSVLLAPLYTNVVLLAKQAASLDQLSHGRLVLGIGLGGREDDYTVSGLPMVGRGRRLDAQLAEIKRMWAQASRGDPGAIGPPPVREGGPELIIGGSSEASFRRAARFGDGWIMGGGSPEMFADAAAGVDKAWHEAGRPGRPRKLSLAYFALGPHAREAADAYLKRYYGWLGETAEQIAASAAVSPDMVRAYRDAFGQSGCDELILFPCSADPEQVGLLAEALRD
jgi:alkanesulfonate monooxygenase SsuD/methylene tetrahydromethanopterin reductase-like flavin-dependent oxidoreductase (luciferase family)